MRIFRSLISAILCRVLFDLCYFFVISHNYAYSGFGYESRLFGYFLSWIIFLPFAFVIAQLNTKAQKFSDYTILFMLLLAFVPFTTMVGLYSFTLSNGSIPFVKGNNICGFPVNYIIYAVIFWIVMVFVHYLSDVIHNNKVSHHIKPRLYRKAAYFLCTVVAVCIILYVSGHYRHFAICFNLNMVYVIRAAAAQFQMSTLLTYILSMSGVVVLLSTVYSIYTKKYVIALLLIGVELLNFGIAAHKGILFELILALLIYICYEKILKGHFIGWLNTLLSVTILEFFVLHSFKLAAIIIRRACFVTNQLSYCYFDFFSTHPPDYFAQSFLRHFGIISKYTPIPYMIADVYFKQPEMAANNGLIADAITNYGLNGAVLLPLLLNVLFSVFDDATKYLPAKLYVVVAVIVACGLQNTFLMPCLLTHGFLVMLLCLYLLSAQEKQKLVMIDAGKASL